MAKNDKEIARGRRFLWLEDDIEGLIVDDTETRSFDFNAPLRRVIIKRVHSRSKCMACEKQPVIAVHWANAHGMAWFCLDDFTKWIQEDERDIVGVWVLKDGVCPKDILKTPAGTVKIRKLGEHISGKEIFKRIGALLERGGPGSGFRGHAGRPGEVGGSVSGPGGASVTSKDKFKKGVHGWLETRPWERSQADFIAGKVPFIEYDPDGRWPAAFKGDHIVVRPSYFELDDVEKIMVLYHEVGHFVTRELLKQDVQKEAFEAIEYFREPWGEEKTKPVSVRSIYHNFVGTDVGGNKLPEEFLSDIYMDLILNGEQTWDPGPEGNGQYARPYRVVAEKAKELGLPSDPLFKWEHTKGEDSQLVVKGGPSDEPEVSDGEPDQEPPAEIGEKAAHVDEPPKKKKKKREKKRKKKKGKS